MHGVLTPTVKGILGGLLGVLVGLLAWHLYTDHVAFHTMLEFLNRNADKIQKLP
jgi:hypothetical protein